MKKIIKMITIAMISVSMFTTTAYAASESGDAERVTETPTATETTQKPKESEPPKETFKANIFDYDNKGNEKYKGDDSDKILFNKDTSDKKYDEKNTWTGSSDNVYSSEYKKNQHYKIIEGLVEDALVDGNIKTTYDVYSGGEKVDLFTGDSQDYVLVFDKTEDGVYSFKVGIDDYKEKFLPIGEDNFFFGMTFGFDFTLGGDRTGMKFDFIGDDDVWVFIDNELVLDLGGIHSKVQGTIDFEDNTVSRSGQFKYDGYKDYITKTATKEFEDGDHTLQFFFLERGASNSRCGITFKLNDVTPIEPSEEPIEEPTVSEPPTESPTVSDEPQESEAPTATAKETETPSATPTVEPTKTPSVPYSPISVTPIEPSEEPMVSEGPTEEPSEEPTVTPSAKPIESEITTEKPSEAPTAIVTAASTDTTKIIATAKPSKAPIEKLTDTTTGTPQTGDNAPIAVVVMIAIISAIGAMISYKRNR